MTWPLGVSGSSHWINMVVELKGRTCTFFGAVPGSILPRRRKNTVKLKSFWKEKKIIEDQREREKNSDGKEKVFRFSLECFMLAIKEQHKRGKK